MDVYNVLVIGILTTIVAGALFILLAGGKFWKRYVAKDRDTRRFVVRAVLLYLAVAAISQIRAFGVFGGFRSPDFLLDTIGDMLLSPLRILQATLPVFVALWFVWRVKPLQVGQARDITDPAKATPIDETVKQVFRSDQFLNALRTSLPKGERDTEYGLDYIPFMLDALRAKRRRFDRRANIFFLVTICVGLLFAGIISYLGYALVNERAFGLPRDVGELKDEVTRMRGLLDEASKLFRPELADIARTFRLGVQKLRVTDIFASQVARIDNALTGLNSIERVDDVLLEIEKTEKSLDPNIFEVRQLLPLLTSTRERLLSVRESAQSLLYEIRQQILRTDQSIKKVQEFGDKDQNRVAELVKRLSIGLVIATFFFGILRYVASQFRANWEQAVRAEDEDLWLRRFYVGLKSAGASQTDRSSVISSLLKGMPESMSVDKKAEDQDGRVNMEFLKELLSAISKKI